MKQLGAICMMAYLLLGPLVFAQTSGDTGSGGDTPPIVQEEKEICTLPWETYQTFVNNKLAYQAAVAANDYTSAQDIFTLMQDTLASNCDTTASIVDVQSTGLKLSCLTLVNNLIAKNNFYIREQQTQDAIDTQAIIQTILDDASCETVLAGDAQESVNLIRQDIADTQTVPEYEVIPYNENVCFMQSGPSHTFTEQINSVQDTTILNDLYGTVRGYITTLQSIIMDPSDTTKQKEREGVLLDFAEKTIDDAYTSEMARSSNYQNDQGFHDILESFVASLDGILSNQGRDALMTWLGNDPSSIQDYVGAIQNLALRGTSSEDKQAAFDDIAVTPRIFIRNDELVDFEQGVADTDAQGLSFIVPGTDVDDIVIRFLNYDTLVIPAIEPEDNGNGTDAGMDEQIQYNDVVMEVYQGDEKILALELDMHYNDATNGPVGGDIALYTKPYIYTGSFTRTTDPVTNIQVIATQIHVYGPAGCDIQVTSDRETLPEQTNEAGELTQPTTINLSANLGKLALELNLVDVADFFDYIQDRREINPDATSAPETAAQVSEANLYYNGTYIARVAPDNDTRVILFSNKPYKPYNLITSYRTDASANYELPIDNTVDVIQSLIDIFQGDDDDGETNLPPAQEDLIKCQGTSGNIVAGYYYYEDDNVMLSSYCQEGYDICGEYYTTLDGIDLYLRSSGTDSLCVNLAQPDPSPNPPVYGCTDPDAPEYNSGATMDDGTCNPDTGYGYDGSGGGTGTVYGCTDQDAPEYNSGATMDDGSCSDTGTGSDGGPIVGCPDPGASNYVQGADESDDNNWAMCE